ncbi:LamB/YcsF family protein [Cohnella lupini]|uniref:UPF0271 protein n=1 Tax=Cohnella lupini TaxID=1294267 RepID=A0A3D9IQN1_9BACL|nr:5-oxoprolinase subunit PxpA [Cohnella lupini]RED63829.1 UPF0271 protein [Cohnella lupini]
MKLIDLNADLGEGYESDERILAYVSSANIACGFHAGDAHTIRKTVESCLNRGVAIGAHPGLPDRPGFGRREMAITPQEARDYILYQVGAVQAFVIAAGGRLRHVKLHGALYHMASNDRQMAASIADAIHHLGPDLMIYGLAGSELHVAASVKRLEFIAEGFADRAYLSDGSLVPRNQPGAVFEDTGTIVRQALRLVEDARVRTLCLHGDTPQAAEHSELISRTLEASGVRIQSPGRI